MQHKHWLLSAGLIITAVAWRVTNWHFGLAPNLEVITASSLIAAVLWGWRGAVGVPLAAMAASDLIIGNSPILLFTWSAFALIGLAGLALRRLQARPSRLMLGALGAGVLGSVFFFVYTNFGVWLMGNLYPHTWAGLMQSYLMGIPFYRTMLIGNLVIVPAYFAVLLLARQYDAQRLVAAASSRQ
jgi:hypothetical protein